VIPNSDDRVSFAISEHGITITDIITKVTGMPCRKILVSTWNSLVYYTVTAFVITTT